MAGYTHAKQEQIQVGQVAYYMNIISVLTW